MRALRLPFLATFFGFVLISAWAAPVLAQTAVAQSRETEPVDQARQVREQFVKVLAKYPPAVARVLKLDPSLLATDAYIAPYPEIGAFLAKHPEVRRSPAYYFEQVSGSSGDGGYYYDPRTRAWDNMMEMFGVFVIMVTITGAFAWLIRTAVDYRRWGRLAKVQAEAHTKLLDRFTGNEELLAYVKSPAGARFLQSSPIALDGNPRAMGAPVSRILWSVQAGVVLAAAGIGMNYVSRRIDPINADPVYMFSVIILSVGLGFLASAGLSYFLSRRLGLLDAPRQSDAIEG